MDPYENIIQMVRDEGKHYNPPVPQLGIYKDNKLEIGGLKISRKHFLINSSLILENAEYWVHQSGNPESGLKKDTRCVLRSGDQVLAYQVEEAKFIIIAKVVAP
jgi:hypothetical protein